MNIARKIFATLACISGLTLQCYHISNSYFEYTTIIDVKLFEPYKIDQPGLSLCYRIIDVINQEQLFKLKQVYLPRKHDANFTYETVYGIVGNLSVAQLFDLTPSPLDLISKTDGCMIRFPTYFIHDNIEYDVCLKYFEVKKYFHREFVCYRYFLSLSSSEQELIDIDYRLSVDYFSMIFHLYLNESLVEDAIVMTSYVHSKKSVNLYDSFQAQLLISNPEPSDVILTYYKTSFTRLKSPYTTDCWEYPIFGTHLEYSYSLINNDTMKLLGKVPFETFIYDRLNVTSITYYDYLQPSLRNLLAGIRDKYLRIGKQTCKFRMILSDMKERRNSNRGISVQVLEPRRQKVNWTLAKEKR